MKRLFVVIFLLVFVAPSLAGEYENALIKNKNTLLYIYSSNCSYCVKFEPIYEKISKTFGDKYNFVKVSADTQYGNQLMRKFGARFVPYVVITDKKTHENSLIAPACLTNLACSEKVLKDY